jgi:phosphatidylserine decarboxylase
MTKEGLKFFLPVLAVALLLLAGWLRDRGEIILSVGVAFFLLSLFILYFFRDPERKPPEGENLILSSADGRIIAIQPLDKVEFLDGGGTLVSVFMSVFNVHVNRAPVSGRVTHCDHNPGRFFPAFKEKASSENEQTELGLENHHGRIIIKQIAGVIARRIVCRVKPGDSLKAGERFGMIRFGSRVDLLLPDNVEIKAKLNQHVKAGETIIGIFRK